MKIQVEIDNNLTDDEVIIRCRNLTEQVAKIQQAVSDVVHASEKFPLYRDSTEYYIPLDEILFFQTEGNGITAHTRDEAYETQYKLYELEDILPGSFMRVSKSTILNTNHIYSINRNLTAASLVAFQNTHKQVFVSRSYYKPLISKLEEKRLQK
ncbi:MAG: LytTR family DNA-binding domain-containing protein [Roseburia sp.]